MLFEHLTAMSESSSKDITLSQDQVESLLQAVSYSICLVGNASSLISATRLSAVLNKINNCGSLASQGKEDYPNAGWKLFGTGFEARLKARAETAQTLMDASSAGRGHSQNRFLFKGTSGPFRSSPYRSRGANRAFRNRRTGCFQPPRSAYQLQGQRSTVDSSSTNSLSKSMFPLYSVLSTSNYLVAGRLAHFIQNWSLLPKTHGYVKQSQATILNSHKLLFK